MIASFMLLEKGWGGSNGTVLPHGASEPDDLRLKYRITRIEAGLSNLVLNRLN